MNISNFILTNFKLSLTMKSKFLFTILVFTLVFCKKNTDQSPSNQEPNCKPISYSVTTVDQTLSHGVYTTTTHTGSSILAYNKSSKLLTTGNNGVNGYLSFDSLIYDSLNNIIKIRYSDSWNALHYNSIVKTINSNLIKVYYASGDSAIITTTNNIIRNEYFVRNNISSIKTSTIDGSNVLGFTRISYDNGIEIIRQDVAFKNFDNKYSPSYLILKNSPELIKLFDISKNNYSQQIDKSKGLQNLSESTCNFLFEYTTDGLVSRIKKTWPDQSYYPIFETTDFVHDNCQ